MYLYSVQLCESRGRVYFHVINLNSSLVIKIDIFHAETFNQRRIWLVNSYIPCCADSKAGFPSEGSNISSNVMSFNIFIFVIIPTPINSSLPPPPKKRKNVSCLLADSCSFEDFRFYSVKLVFLRF